MCDPQLCNDLQARCTVTIFSVLLISFLGSVSLPLPSLTLALIHSCHHRLLPPLPSTIAAASSRQCADVQRQHTGIYASPGPHLHVLGSLGLQPFSLSLPLLSPGEHPRTWHAGTVLHYSSMPFPVTSGINSPALACILSA